MYDDFVLIKHKLSEDLENINIYPIGDLHVGSREFNETAFKKWLEIVKSDPNGYVVIIGDMMDNGLKNSKTNSFEATMSPFEQKMYLVKEFEPIKDSILGAIQGNHEYRSNIVSDMCPLYDVMARLDIEHVYRPNMAFIKINLGRRKVDRQCSYTLVLGHGGSKNKTMNFGYSIDGMDVLVTGHTHSPASNFQSKIVIDNHNESVGLRDFTHIIVPSFTTLGGYALRGMYMPQSGEKFPVIQLNGKEKEVNVLWR